MVLPSRHPAAIPASKAGIGLRSPHRRDVVDRRPDVGWLEVHTENYMAGGAPLRALEKARELYPVTLHGVGLSLGSADGLDEEHLARIAALAAIIEPGLMSEHLSWSKGGPMFLNDLVPVPTTTEALEIVCRNVDRFQEAVGRQILIENPSCYVAWNERDFEEPEFIAEIMRRTGCGLLLDVNNIVVSAHNLGFDAHEYLRQLPDQGVGQIHVAGHAENDGGEGETVKIDDHGSAVDDVVWALYHDTLAKYGPVPTLVEWDSAVPDLSVLVAEADKATALLDAANSRKAGGNARAA